MDKVTRQCPLSDHNLFEEEGEPKRYRTEVLPLTSLPARPNRLTCILPSTTAVFSYAIGPRKLSANEQFFVGAQTVVCYKQLSIYQTFVL